SRPPPSISARRFLRSLHAVVHLATPADRRSALATGISSRPRRLERRPTLLSGTRSLPSGLTGRSAVSLLPHARRRLSHLVRRDRLPQRSGSCYPRENQTHRRRHRAATIRSTSPSRPPRRRRPSL